jgi:hypothetical protein
MLGWIDPKTLMPIIASRPHEHAQCIAAQIAFPKSFDRELRKIHLQVFYPDDAKTAQEQAASAFVACSVAAVSDPGDDVGFDQKRFFDLAKKLASENEWVELLACWLLQRDAFIVEIRRCIIETFLRMREPADVMVAIAEATARVKATCP